MLIYFEPLAYVHSLKPIKIKRGPENLYIFTLWPAIEKVYIFSGPHSLSIFKLTLSIINVNIMM